MGTRLGRSGLGARGFRVITTGRWAGLRRRNWARIERRAPVSDVERTNDRGHRAALWAAVGAGWIVGGFAEDGRVSDRGRTKDLRATAGCAVRGSEWAVGRVRGGRAGLRPRPHEGGEALAGCTIRGSGWIVGRVRGRRAGLRPRPYEGGEAPAGCTIRGSGWIVGRVRGRRAGLRPRPYEGFAVPGGVHDSGFGVDRRQGARKTGGSQTAPLRRICGPRRGARFGGRGGPSAGCAEDGRVSDRAPTKDGVP